MQAVSHMREYCHITLIDAHKRKNVATKDMKYDKAREASLEENVSDIKYIKR